jgi:Holliday junction resolvasome RuvABC ATP-dependent DNA helicase subunit
MRPSEYLESARAAVEAGDEVVISVGDLVGLWGARNRTRKMTARVRSALSRAGLRTMPDFATVPLTSVVSLVDRSAAQAYDPAVAAGRVPRASREDRHATVVAIETALETLGGTRGLVLGTATDPDDDRYCSEWFISGLEDGPGWDHISGVLSVDDGGHVPSMFRFYLMESFPDHERAVRTIASFDFMPDLQSRLRGVGPGEVDIELLLVLPVEPTHEEAVETLQRAFDTARSLYRRVSQELDEVRAVLQGVAGPAPTVDEVLAEFATLIGVGEVERQVDDMVASARVHQARVQAGLRSMEFTPHLVLTGNPGTGKTTVARLIAKLYRALGLLDSGHLVEVSRADLVGQYIGHTEDRTRECIDRAKGGVLFIDEAYALAGRGEKDFGNEVIDVLLVEMENRRGEFAVIVAGYDNEMASFLSANPGLKSRFDQTIRFRDFTDDELVEIFESRAAAEDYLLADGVVDAVRGLFAAAGRGENFSNGRFVRRVFDRTRMNQQRRLHAANTLDVDSLKLIAAEDVATLAELDAPKRRPIGFQAGGLPHNQYAT